MRTESYSQISVVRADDPIDFQDAYNDRIRSLSQNHKIINDGSDKIRIREDGSCLAVITYEEVSHIADCVADEFHAEGIRYLCRNCPYLDDPADKRKKRCTCRYADYGVTHKDHEACEVFYRDLKAGRVKPIEDYMR